MRWASQANLCHESLFCLTRDGFESPKDKFTTNINWTNIIKAASRFKRNYSAQLAV